MVLEVAVGILSILLILWATMSRLQNIGSSKWWSLLIFVPLVNLVLFVRCIAMPKGFRHTGQLDMAAKVMTGFVLAIILLMVGRIVYVSVGGG